MSAPRKIWVDYERDMFSFSEHAPTGSCPASETAYHHDDVVRELVRVGSNMHAFVDLYGDEAMRSAAAEWRAALAKIAQEG